MTREIYLKTLDLLVKKGYLTSFHINEKSYYEAVLKALNDLPEKE